MFISILSIFLIVIAGYLLRHFSVIKKSWLKVLNSFVYYVALPALVINNIAGYNWSSEDVGPLLLGNFIYLAVSALVVIGIVAALPIKRKAKASIILVALPGNTVYLGIPLVNELLGGSFSSTLNGPITAISIIQLIVSLIILLVLLEFFLVSGRNFKKLVGRLIKNPLIISMLAGVTLALSGGLQGVAEDLLGEPLDAVAATASPLALLALGGFMHQLNWHKAKLSVILAPLVIKMAVLPLIAYAIFYNLDTEQHVLNSSVLLAGMPVAVTAFVLADEYKLDKASVAVAITTSTLLAPLTLLGSAYLLGV